MSLFLWIASINNIHCVFRPVELFDSLHTSTGNNGPNRSNSNNKNSHCLFVYLVFVLTAHFITNLCGEVLLGLAMCDEVTTQHSAGPMVHVFCK